MLRKIAFALLFAAFAFDAMASDSFTKDEDGIIWKGIVGPYAEVSFVLVKSTPSYDDAIRFARRLANQTTISLDLRELEYHPPHGLTWPKAECEKDFYYPYPCYVARGRYDSGSYISIERSDAYESFTPGLFVVIAASGAPAKMKKVAESLRTVVPDAYVKSEMVYFGCMH